MITITPFSPSTLLNTTFTVLFSPQSAPHTKSPRFILHAEEVCVSFNNITSHYPTDFVNIAIAFGDALDDDDDFLGFFGLVDKFDRFSAIIPYPGMDFRSQFALDGDEHDEEGEGEERGSKKEKEKEGVWYEGRVYHVREDFRSNPFQSISVLWMSQVC